DQIARAHGVDMPQVALAWLLANPLVTAPIIGANDVEQLRPSLAAVDLELDDEELQALDDVSDWRGS
ncbi:MAG: aldo/keto reductase, partial [Anaerolineae bacterium]